MAMSRKHYVAAARLLRAEYQAAQEEAARDSVLRISDGLAQMFAEDNQRFDRWKFKRAVETGAGI